MGLVEELTDHFETKNLYEVLEITDFKCSPAVVKKAYFKLARVHHPDKCTSTDTEQKALQTTRFQLLGKVYSVLSDSLKRSAYDETGVVDDDEGADLDGDVDWDDYFRAIFKKVSIDAIKEFTAEYQGSQEEREDVLNAYESTEGNVTKMLDLIMCAQEVDVDRFVKICEEAIAEKKVKKYKAFAKSRSAKASAARKRKAERESAEADEMLREMQEKENIHHKGKGKRQRITHGKDATKEAAQELDLAAMIRSRQAQRRDEAESMLAALEAKYVKKGPKNKIKAKATATAKADDDEFVEPSEEFFAAAAAKMNKNREQARAKRAKAHK